MSVIGTGTIISKDNLDKFYKSLLVELYRSKDIYKTDNVVPYSKEAIFKFTNKDNSFEARLIAIDNDRKNERIFVYYKLGIIGFAESIQTIREIEFFPYDEEVIANMFITNKECFVYGCENKTMYEVIKEKYKKEGMKIYDLEFSTRTKRCLLNNHILDLYDLSQFSERDLNKIRNLGPKSISEIKDKLKEHGLSLREDNKRRWYENNN